MEISIKKLKEGVENPEKINSNSFKFKSFEIATKVSADGRLILSYSTGMAVNIENGYIGVLSQIEDASVKSLIPTVSTNIIFPGEYTDITFDFKTNTDSIPSIYEPNTFFCKLTIIPIPEVNATIEEYVKPVEENEAV
jgi:hypothetical protein